ncbi:sec-independent protein translocase protein TatB [Desulfobaculum xiamenense]|uniref:Sec-independent protein translocase protein TatA n=1 Tax=Desulfobaculum xiamenense TaxID=995050 RepID=A0A846QGG8_9BACT|nr:Sec-independent protein translocase protein TatB [Desulfobaculum xiamenense]NJB67388.1 sec-independent protein translocase protein TatB [Desulfobaculum xiamenense]
MFGIGSTELLLILGIALLVIGPKKLPQMARSLGKAMGEFKRVSSDVKRTIDAEVDRVERQERQDRAKAELKPEDASPRTETAASTQAAAAKPADAPADSKNA